MATSSSNASSHPSAANARTAHRFPRGLALIDKNGIALAYCYARDDLAEKTIVGQHLTTDEALRLAVNIAKLAELLR